LAGTTFCASYSRRTASWVRGQKVPVTGSFSPWLFNRRCSSDTWGPLAPSRSGEGEMEGAMEKPYSVFGTESSPFE